MLDIRTLGAVPYREALGSQEAWCHARRRAEIPDTIVLLEHPAVITQGRRATASDILAPATLHAEGIEIHSVPRGGETTYHGRGQLIGYFVIRLAQIRRVAALVRGVEEALIEFLREYDVDARRRTARPGVWVGERKIAAVGLAIQRGVTSHGFALNINPSLEPYRWIMACGISAERYTSLAVERPECPVSVVEAQQKIIPHLRRMYQRYNRESV